MTLRAAIDQASRLQCGGRHWPGARWRRAALGSVALGLSVWGVPAPAMAAGGGHGGGAVGQPTLLMSSYSGAATGVTYTVSFIATGGLPLGSTVRLSAPAGTDFSPQVSYYIADDTTGGNCGPDPVAASGDKLSLGCGGAGSSSIAAGNEVTVTLPGITNRASAGPGALVLSTSINPAPVHLAFTLTPTTTVSAPTVELSSTSASATDVTYTVGFVSTNGLWSGHGSSTVTLVAAPGTVFPPSGGSYFINDDTAGGSCGPVGPPEDATGDTITLLCGGAGTEPVPAGQHVTVSVGGVKNSSRPGAHLLSVRTSSDPKPAVAAYALTPSTAVGAAMVSRSPSAPGASGATWTVGFIATNGWTYDTTISLKAPAGTKFPTESADYCLSDDGSDSARCWYGVSVTGSGSAVTLLTQSAFGNGEFTGAPIFSGEHMTLTIKDVTNGTSGGELTLSTGADPVPVHVAIGHPGAPSLTLSSRSAGAQGVEYEAGFTATVTQKVSTVTLSFPSGTTFQTVPKPDDVVRDDAGTGEDTLPDLTETVSGSSITLRTSSTYGQFTIYAGDYVTVIVYGAHNPGAPGPRRVVVTTSLSRSAISLPAYRLVAPTRVTSAVLSTSSASAGAGDAGYQVSFTATDGLTPGGSYMLAPSTVSISAPGTTFATTNVCDELVDDTSGAHTGCPQVKVVGGKGSITLDDNGYGQIRVAHGDRVTVFLYGVTAPAAGRHVLTVSTSSDPLPVAVSYKLGPPSAVTHAVLWRSSSAAGAAGVTYTIGFTVTNGLQPGNDSLGASTLRIVAAAGTIFPSGSEKVLERDDTWTGWNNDWAAVTGGGSTLAVPASLARPGDHVTVVVKGVQNPSGPQSVTVSTSSDVLPATAR